MTSYSVPECYHALSSIGAEYDIIQCAWMLSCTLLYRGGLWHHTVCLNVIMHSPPRAEYDRCQPYLEWETNVFLCRSGTDFCFDKIRNWLLLVLYAGHYSTIRFDAELFPNFWLWCGSGGPDGWSGSEFLSLLSTTTKNVLIQTYLPGKCLVSCHYM